MFNSMSKKLSGKSNIRSAGSEDFRVENGKSYGAKPVLA
jgi:hypothetical protein